MVVVVLALTGNGRSRNDHANLSRIGLPGPRCCEAIGLHNGWNPVGNRCWVAMLSCELLWLDVTTTTLWQQAVVLGCGVGVGVGPGVGAVADGGSNSNRGSNIIGSGGVGVVVLVLGGGAGGGGCGDRDNDDADTGE